MSLNGLDDVKVKEAHEAAAAEPGGWFLLKYVSRDEVELHGRGNGGIVEIRNIIGKFEEPAPLFGFLRYRRRNVIIRYIPEGCSRLVQARVTVHFNSVTERFSPHDTEFSITSPKDLRDTTLSAACSLHTASGSSSSSTSSLRRRRLMEIAEDADEDAKRQSIVPEEHPSTALTPSTTAASIPLPASPPILTTASSYRSVISDLETSPPPPREPLDLPSPSPSKTHDDHRRQSSQSLRPDLYSLSSYGSNGKPKIKLGPRPSLDVGGRPHTLSATSHFRPVSQLPAGLKLFGKGPQKDNKKSQSHLPTEPPSMTISPPPIPETMAPQMRPHTSGGRPTTSSGVSVKSAVSVKTSTVPKMPTITPEKARLMKALELRKKREKAPSLPTNEPQSSNTDGLVTLPVEDTRLPDGPPQDVHDTLSILNEMAEAEDSSIAFDANSTMKTDESDATRSDSYPVSPVGPSERAESTRASSISESTDETVQEAHTSKPASEEPKLPDEESEYTIQQPKEADTYTQSATEKNFEEVEELPLLRPVAYTPLQSPVVHEAKSLKGMFPEELKDSTSITIVSEISPEPSVDKGVPFQDVPKALIPEVGAHTFTTEAPSADPEFSHPAEPVVIPTSPVRPETKEWKVPRSKFSSQNLRAATEDPVVPTGPMPLASGVMAPRSKFSSQNLGTASEDPVIPTEPMPLESGERVPKSKFSSQNIKAATEDPNAPREALAFSASDSAANLPPQSPVESTFSVDSKRSLSENDEQENGPLSSKRRKRRAVVEPIRTDLESIDISAANSIANISSDEELMEELQSAVVQEAKPISVAKSPISPVSPQFSPKKKMGDRFSRAFSSPMQKETLDSQKLSPPEIGRSDSTRSVSASAAYLNRINSESSKPLAKKVNLGSGISQRIKALEKLSANAPGSSPSAGTTAPSTGASPAFFSVRKSNVQTASRSPSIADRASSLTRNTPSPSPSGSRESSPETFRLRERSGSVQNRLNAFSAAPVLIQPQLARPESVSVTARIIRDPNQLYPKAELATDPSDYAPLDLKQSPLVIDHQKAISSSQPHQKETIRERRLSTSSRTTTKSRRSSITVVKDLIKEGRSSFAEHRRSITLEPPRSSSSLVSPGRSSSRPPSVHQHQRPLSISSRRSSRDAALSPPPTPRSSSSISDEKEKKTNRASRIIRRMSMTLSSGRKALTHQMSPTVREESEPLGPDSRSLTSSHPSNYSLTPSTNIGDVNVQFPDTLLWKRRSMLLDAQGNLILLPALSNGNNAKEKTTGGAMRRFHLGEFRTPGVPDVEMQELPNSVVLDFIEGGGLQIACEDRAGQMRVLGVLQDAHRSWGAFGQ